MSFFRNITIIISILFITSINFSVFSQTIENVRSTFKKNKLIVKFDLVNFQSSYWYKIDLQLKDQNGQPINPQKVIGNVGYIKGGINKKIVWKLSEETNFFFRTIKPIITVKEKKVLGGPDNAFKSLMVPGLGAHKVSKEYKSALNYRTGIVYGILIYGIFQNIRNDIFKDKKGKYYNKYLDAKKRKKIKSYYKKANSANKKATNAQNQSKVAFWTGGILWAADIAWVAIKGLQNQKERKSLTTNKQVTINYDHWSNSYMVGFSYNF